MSLNGWNRRSSALHSPRLLTQSHARQESARQEVDREGIAAAGIAGTGG